MLSKVSETEILKGIGALEKAQQEKVLRYIKLLVPKNKDQTPNAILQFAGAFDTVSLEEMTDAIYTGCEKIDKIE